MSHLATRFATRMCKWAAGSEDEATSSSCGKRSRRSSPDEEVMSEKLIYVLSSFHMLF